MSEALVRTDEGEQTMADMLDDVEEPYARIIVEGVSAKQVQSDMALVSAVEEADGCLNCGDATNGAAFCDFGCLQEWDGHA